MGYLGVISGKCMGIATYTTDGIRKLKVAGNVTELKLFLSLFIVF